MQVHIAVYKKHDTQIHELSIGRDALPHAAEVAQLVEYATSIFI